MKTINRSKIRGAKIEEDCKKANVCTEFDKDTKFCFCYGIVDLRYDDYIDKCENCKACVRNMPSTVEEFDLLKKRAKVLK